MYFHDEELSSLVKMWIIAIFIFLINYLTTNIWVYFVAFMSAPLSMNISLPAPLSMEFSRKEYWGGLPFPYLGDLPDTEVEPGSPIL